MSRTAANPATLVIFDSIERLAVNAVQAELRGDLGPLPFLPVLSLWLWVATCITGTHLLVT